MGLDLLIFGSNPETAWCRNINDYEGIYQTVYLKHTDDNNHVYNSNEYKYSYYNETDDEIIITIKFVLSSFVCPNGIYEAGMDISQIFQATSSVTIPKGTPQISVSESQLNFEDSNNSDQFYVENTGYAKLDWTASKDQNWFEFDPPYGNNLFHDDKDIIDVIVHPENILQDQLQYKNHSGAISFSSDWGNPIVTINVEIPKPDAPTLQISGPELGNPTLTWNAVSLVYRYKVERRNITLGTGWQEIASVDENSYTDDEFCILSVGGDEFQYRVKAVNGAGSSGYSNTVSIEGLEYQAFNSGGPQTLMPELTEEYMLISSYPNPGNPGTTIRFQLPEESRVVLKIFNVRGEAVRTLINEQKAAGHHEIYWDGRNERGTSVVTGMYIILMEADGRVFHKKFSLIK